MSGVQNPGWLVIIRDYTTLFILGIGLIIIGDKPSCMCGLFGFNHQRYVGIFPIIDRGISINKPEFNGMIEGFCGHCEQLDIEDWMGMNLAHWLMGHGIRLFAILIHY